MSSSQRLYPSGPSQPPPPKSPGFGPFRRPTTPLFSSTFGSSSSSAAAGRAGEGGRSEGGSSSSSSASSAAHPASISKSPVPSKPPKPAALRVKKPKSLSISLLTGSNNNNNSSSDTSASILGTDAGAATSSSSNNSSSWLGERSVNRFGYGLGKVTSPLQHRSAASQQGREARPSLDLSRNRSTQLFDTAEGIEVLETRARSRSALGFYDSQNTENESERSSSSSSSGSGGGGGIGGGGNEDFLSSNAEGRPPPFSRGHFRGAMTKKLKGSDGAPHAQRPSAPLPTDPVYVIGKEPAVLSASSPLVQHDRPSVPARLPGAGQDDFLTKVERYRRDPASEYLGHGSSSSSSREDAQGPPPSSHPPHPTSGSPFSPSSSAASPFLNTISATASPSISARAPPKRRPLPPPLSATPFQPHAAGPRSAPGPDQGLMRSAWDTRPPASATSAEQPSSPLRQQQQQQQQQQQYQQQSPLLYEVRNRSASQSVLRRPPSLLGSRQSPTLEKAQSSPLASPNQAFTFVPPPQRQAKRDMLDGSSSGQGLTANSSGNYSSGAGGAAGGGGSGGGTTSVGGGALQSLGQQLGGMGVAVGKRGWGFMKNWSADRSSSIPSPTSLTAGGRRVHGGGMASLAQCNDATKLWLSLPDAPSSQSRASGAQHAMEQGISGSASPGPNNPGVFGMPLREAVLRSRLGRVPTKDGPTSSSSSSSSRSSMSSEQISAELSALDLGSEFKVDLPVLSPLASPRSSSASSLRQSLHMQRKAVSREVARSKYLPAVVVRCIEAVERWGMDEEGIYRLSGRSSHTAKLRMIFDGPTMAPGASSNAVPDLELADVGPADLDLNSVCSLLKSYLRDLPENLLPPGLADEFNRASKDVSGLALVGDPSASTDHSRDKALRTSLSDDGEPLHVKVARAIAPLMDRLPAANWYLLRELAMHLSDLVQPNIVQKTRMPLTNLCLVLAPTLSLSVIMLRALVECRAILFNTSCPGPDDALDSILPFERGQTRRASRLARKPSQRPSTSPLLGSSARIAPGPDGDDDGGDPSKRLSIATITDLNKRKSSSSVMTLRRPQHGSPTINTAGVSHNYSVRPASEFGGLAFGSATNSPATSFSWDSDLEDERAPPIASRFIRSRQNSIIGLSPSSNSPSASRTLASGGSGVMSKPPSQASLASSYLRHHDSAFHGASSPRLRDFDSDRDSINSRATLDDSWTTSLGAITGSGAGSSGSHATPSIAASTSGDSIRSRAGSGGGVGALDRPRPPTSGSGRFWSSRGDGLKTSVSGGSSGSGHRLRSNNASQSSLAEDLAKQPQAAKPLLSHQRAAESGERHGDSTADGVDDAPIHVDQVRTMWEKAALR